LDGNPNRRVLEWLERAVQNPALITIWVEYRSGVLQNGRNDSERVRAVMNLPVVDTDLWDRIVESGIKHAIECASDEERPQVTRVASCAIWNPDRFSEFVSERLEQIVGGNGKAYRTGVGRGKNTPAGRGAPGRCSGVEDSRKRDT
jgi:hypothetical protein